MICFSIDDKKSFEHVSTYWIPELDKNHTTVRGYFYIMVLVGLKADLRSIKDSQDLVSKSDAQKLAKKLNFADYIECSSADKSSMEHLFKEALRLYFDRDVNKRKPGQKSSSFCSIL